MVRQGKTAAVREDRPLFALIATVTSAGLLVAVAIASALLSV